MEYWGEVIEMFSPVFKFMLALSALLFFFVAVTGNFSHLFN